jgi:O-antigen ligase
MTISKELLVSLLKVSPILLIITFFNGYIFHDDNIIIFIPILFVYAFARPFLKIRTSLVINVNTFLFLVLLIYFIFRFDGAYVKDLRPGVDILNLVFYILTFVLGGIISYNVKKIPTALWLGVLIYILMVFVRSLYSLEELQKGYNISTAIGIMMIIPYALASPERYRKLIFKISFFSLIIFFALIGARGAILSVLGMYFFIQYYSFFSSTRMFYAFTFVILFASIAAVIYLYLMYAYYDHVALFSSDSMFNILQKRVGTRLDVWTHSLYFIANEPLVGYGTNMSTSLQAPSPDLDFLMPRSNIAAHSTYFEVLFRSGGIGLFIYLLLLYNLWMSFYKYQHIYEIRIASGMLVSIIISSMTSTIMIFNTLEFWACFAWYYLGFSYGKIIKLSRLDQLSKLQKNFIKQVNYK